MERYRAVQEHIVSIGLYSWPRVDEGGVFGQIVSAFPRGGAGLSFWVFFSKQRWYICSWLGKYWEIPESVNHIDVIEKYLRSDGSVNGPNEVLVEEFGLIEYDDDSHPVEDLLRQSHDDG